MIDNLSSFLAPNGFILIQDYFKSSNSKELSNRTSLSWTAITKDEFETYIKEKSLKILLRTSDYHLMRKTGYIISK